MGGARRCFPGTRQRFERVINQSLSGPHDQLHKYRTFSIGKARGTILICSAISGGRTVLSVAPHYIRRPTANHGNNNTEVPETQWKVIANFDSRGWDVSICWKDSTLLYYTFHPTCTGPNCEQQHPGWRTVVSVSILMSSPSRT